MKPQTPMSNAQQSPKPQCPKFWDFERWDLIGHWSLVIGFFRNTRYPLSATRYHQRGFTLVEMIVALGFFTVIMLVVISVLASVSGANEKARTMRVVIDNLNFAVENMARTLRVGSQYHCGSSGTLTSAKDCDDPQAGSEFIAFENIQSGGGTSAFQKRTDLNGTGFIERANNCEAAVCPSANWNRITAPEIDVDLLRFYVTKPLEADGGQAQILIIAKGTAGKGTIQTEFDIQTTVTQRLADS